jgi:hypothetical protein
MSVSFVGSCSMGPFVVFENLQEAQDRFAAGIQMGGQFVDLCLRGWPPGIRISDITSVEVIMDDWIRVGFSTPERSGCVKLGIPARCGAKPERLRIHFARCHSSAQCSSNPNPVESAGMKLVMQLSLITLE